MPVLRCHKAHLTATQRLTSALLPPQQSTQCDLIALNGVVRSIPPASNCARSKKRGFLPTRMLSRGCVPLSSSRREKVPFLGVLHIAPSVPFLHMSKRMGAELDLLLQPIVQRIWCVVACMPNKRIGWTGTFHSHAGKSYSRDAKAFFREILRRLVTP